ncbi:MAG: helix-turn-helix transcriptional regulator [Lachnospiraceae bacterium]|nr:helix-turn-helix transcriptional regulator [Lachnospiraceae bacterium]
MEERKKKKNGETIENLTEQKDILISLRTEAKMSRKEFAAFFDIPYSTVTDWELGKRQMPEYVLRLLAYRLKIEGYVKKDLESGG